MKVFILIILFPVCAFANDYSWDNYIVQQDNSVQLKYNTFQHKWSYERSNSVLQYNTFEHKWQYAEPNAQPRYNSFENKWELK